MGFRIVGVAMGLVLNACGTDAATSAVDILDEIVELERQQALEEDHRHLQHELGSTRQELRALRGAQDREQGWWCFAGRYGAAEVGKCTRTLDACAKDLARAE